jgi:hypothetical protein
MTVSAFDWELGQQMVSQPKFTKRAAEQIARLEAVRRRHAPPGNYLSFIGWENEVEPGSSRAPVFRTYYTFSDAEGVPAEFQVECHGVKLAYNIPERLLARLQSSVLDFDGERFVFVESGDAEQA